MDMHVTREGKAFVFDPYISGYDTTFWSKVSGAGTPSVSGGDLVLTQAEISTFSFYDGADVEFTLNVPAVPTSGDVRAWGFKVPALGNRGRIEFDVTDAVFSLKVYTDAGVALLNQTVTWSASWTAADTIFKIAWQSGGIRFFIGTTQVASCGLRGNATNPTCPTLPMSIHVSNANNDSMKLSSVVVRNVKHLS